MASKTIVLAALLVCVLAASQGDAQLSTVGGSINIAGTIFCSLNGNIVGNAITPTPVFPNATVQVSCGGNVLNSGITNANGLFSIPVNALQLILSSILTPCNVAVTTPLASCNASLPGTQILQAPVQLITNTVSGVIGIVPLLFRLINL